MNFRAGHLGRNPGKVTDVPSKTHEQMTDKLGRMSLNSRTHKTDKPPPSMKAGGWHSQSEIPARRYSRKVVGWVKNLCSQLNAPYASGSSVEKRLLCFYMRSLELYAFWCSVEATQKYFPRKCWRYNGSSVEAIRKYLPRKCWRYNGSVHAFLIALLTLLVDVWGF